MTPDRRHFVSGFVLRSLLDLKLERTARRHGFYLLPLKNYTLRSPLLP
jgi:hypothetical protein